MAQELINNKNEIYYQSSGVVKSYNSETGYGFISTMDEPDTDIYVHYSNIISDSRVLTIGEKVDFLYKKHDKGFRAYQVTKVK